MARKVQVVLTDDLDGGVAAETVAFSLDGRSYVIDLSAENAAALRASFAPWVAKGRKPDREETIPVKVARRSNDAVAVRLWAIGQGMEIAPRGRLSGEIRAAYAAAHPSN